MASMGKGWLAGAGLVLSLTTATVSKADGFFLPAQTAGGSDQATPVYLDNTIVNPAEEMRRPSSQPYQESGGLTHPWELPPVNVVATSGLREEQRVGSYAQPVWTADRRFAESGSPALRGMVIPYRFILQ